MTKVPRTRRARKNPSGPVDIPFTYDKLATVPVSAIFELTNPQLKRIFNEAPTDLTDSISVSSTRMLQPTLELRDKLMQLRFSINVTDSAEDRIDWFCNASIEDIFSEANLRPANLKTILKTVQESNSGLSNLGLDIDESLLPLTFALKAQVVQERADKAAAELEEMKKELEGMRKKLTSMENQLTSDNPHSGKFHSPVVREKDVAQTFAGVSLPKRMSLSEEQERAETGNPMSCQTTHLPYNSPRDIHIPTLTSQQNSASSLLMDIPNTVHEVERRVTEVRDDSLTPVTTERGRGEKRRLRPISKRIASSEDDEEHTPMKEEGNMLTPVKKKRRVKAELEEFETPFKKKRGKEKGDGNDTDISPASAKGKGVISSAEKANARKRRIEEFDIVRFVEQGARALHNKTDGVEWSLEDCRAIVKLLENGIEPRRDEDQEKHYMTLLKVFGKVAHLRKAAGEKDSDDWKELREKFVMLGPNKPRAMRKFIFHCLEL